MFLLHKICLLSQQQIHYENVKVLLSTEVTQIRPSAQKNVFPLKAHPQAHSETTSGNRKSIKNDENCFLFYLKSSFRSEDN